MEDPERAHRRELRQDIMAGAGVIISLFAPLTSALGFSPLANIWSGLAIVLGAIVVLTAIILHDRGMAARRREGVVPERRRGLGAVFLQPMYLLCATTLVLVAGVWLGVNLRNVLALTFHGALSDLDVRPPPGMSQPAVVALRRSYQNTCFLTQATVDLRNATGSELRVGLISASLDLRHGGNEPLLAGRNNPDIRSQNTFLSGIALLTGPEDNWLAKVNQNAQQLSVLRPGQTTQIAVRQEDYGGRTCINDPNASLYKSFDDSAVRLTAGIAVLRPDGSVQRQDINSGDLSVRFQRQ